MTARSEMLKILSDDLYTQGWDKQNKLWFVLGEAGDEYLEYVGEFTMEPTHWMMHRAEEGVLRERVRGVVVCYESWTYPAELRQVIDGSPVAEAYRSLVSPMDHPDRKQVRSLVYAAKDGAVMRCEKFSEDERTEEDEMTDVEPTGTTGDHLVDFMRAILDINKLAQDPMQALSIVLANSGRMQEIILQASQEKWTSARMAAEIYKLAPADLQAQLDETMPSEIREFLDADGYRREQP